MKLRDIEAQAVQGLLSYGAPDEDSYAGIDLPDGSALCLTEDTLPEELLTMRLIVHRYNKFGAMLHALRKSERDFAGAFGETCEQAVGLRQLIEDVEYVEMEGQV